MLNKLLAEAVRLDASDIHLTAGQPPFFRVSGDLFQTGEVLAPPTVDSILEELLTPRLRTELESTRSIDFSYVDTELARRFRVNVYYQRKVPALAMRLIASNIPSLDELGAPPALKRFIHAAQGLILVTGRTGSGKSTTLAAFLNELCRVRPVHLLTLEDPIEFEYAAPRSFVSQRELGQDFTEFADAVRTAMREMPDVLLIGEVRDAATMHAALEASAAGVLVLATLHTRSAAETAMRVETMFPLVQRDNLSTARQDCDGASNLRGGGFNRKPCGAFFDSSRKIRPAPKRNAQRTCARYADNGRGVEGDRLWQSLNIAATTQRLLNNAARWRRTITPKHTPH